MQFLGILKNKFTETLGERGREKKVKGGKTTQRGGKEKGKIIQNKIISINLLS